MKKLFLTFVAACTIFCNLNASVAYANAHSTSIPTGIIVLIAVLSVLLIVGIVWAILRPIRRRRRIATNTVPPPPPPRVRIRPRRTPRRRVIIVR